MISVLSETCILDSFLFFPELSFDECVHAFRSRFSTIMKLRSHMPIISDDAMNQLVMRNAAILRLYVNLSTRQSEINEESLKGLMEFLPHEKSDEDIVGCLIALCGWETQSLQSEAAHSNLLVCTTCNQKLVASDLLTIHSNEKDSRRGVPVRRPCSTRQLQNNFIFRQISVPLMSSVITARGVPGSP